MHRKLEWKSDKKSKFTVSETAYPPIIKRLGQVGTITAFKMLDGSNVGLVVQFDDNFATWFFEDELKAMQ